MVNERVVCSVLGLEAIERRRLVAEEAESLERRVAAAIGRARLQMAARATIFGLPFVGLFLAVDVNGLFRPDESWLPVALALAASAMLMVVLELTSMRDVGARRLLLLLLGALGIYALGFFVAYGEWPTAVLILAAALVVLGASLPFFGRLFEDLPTWISLERLARETESWLLVMHGHVAIDGLPRRLRELGLTDQRAHRFTVLEGSFAIVEIDGRPTDRFPHVPIAKVHLVERADETLVEQSTAEPGVRSFHRALSSGELDELARIRRREMARFSVALVPIAIGVLHAMHGLEFVRLVTGLFEGVVVGFVFVPLLLALLVGRFVVHFRVGRDIARRTALVERRVGAPRGEPPLREVLLPSGRPWTRGGSPDAERMRPYD